MRSLLVLCALAGVAHAKPMSSRLDDILQRSPTIVIAKYVDAVGPAQAPTAYHLDVDRVLRGTRKPGTFTVKPSPDGHAYFKAGTRLVAFVTSADEWIAYAAPFAGPSVEDGVLRASGFFDFNAHLVWPGVFTLAQLEALVVKNTPMAWTFRGPIMVGSASGPVASKIEVFATTPTVMVTGMPAIAGFPKPTVDVGSWDGDDVHITWQRTLGRPLVLVGTATGKNADGSIAVTYRMEYPGYLTEADLRKYLANPRLGHPYYVFEVRTAKTKIPLVIGKDIGRVGTLGTEQLTGLELAPNRAIRTATATVALDAATKQLPRGISEELVAEAMTGPIGCTYTSNGVAVPCTLVYLSTKFATN